MTAISIGAPRHKTVPIAAGRVFTEGDRGITLVTTGVLTFAALAGLNNGWWTILSAATASVLTVEADALAAVDIVSRLGTVDPGPPKSVVSAGALYDEVLIKLIAPNVLQISGDIA